MADVIPFPVEHSQPYAVLVVEDEAVIRAVLCDFLAEHGLSPLSAANADDALVLIQDGAAIDLVFSDVRMPGELDGCALARWILENKPELPVILATGDLGKASVIGLSDIEIFAKPYDFNVAVRKIRDTIVQSKMRTG